MQMKPHQQSPDPSNRAVSACLERAELFFEGKRKRLTPIRRRVLEILLAQGCAMTAYKILDQLKADGKAPHPPVAYRALDFLVEFGFVHKIEHLNAYVACTHPHAHHAPAFMICRLCDKVTETASPASTDMMQRLARETGFVVEETILEAVGICPDCCDDAGVAPST
ncbi:transcriptional repressor [Sagittula stellata]|uniref:Putative ferric uptake regulator, FUR family protein n=2 Tax=Sagittula stellata TaxID=52603 RepID=A3K4R4_SAGS3|nr:transcriptional repressor [Sagittula stellata]EBA07963.1 putative ferric uptake regulator, FUR family protein [Sagittula stellata E-37]